MDTTQSINERGYVPVEIEADLKPCPLCEWPIINAFNFCEPEFNSPAFAKIACGRCGCRITGGSGRDLTSRWNNRPKAA